MNNCSDCPNPVGAHRPNLESVMKLAEDFPESTVCLSMPRGQQPFLKVDGGPDTPVMAYTLDDVTDVAGIPMCGGPTLKDAGARAEAGLSAFAAAESEVEQRLWVHDDDEGGLKQGMKLTKNCHDNNRAAAVSSDKSFSDYEPNSDRSALGRDKKPKNESVEDIYENYSFENILNNRLKREKKNMF